MSRAVEGQRSIGETEPTPVLVLAAVERELEPFLQLLDPAWRSRVQTRVTGVGKISSALETERALTEWQPDRVVQIGCAGAFPASGLEPGDVGLASEEVLADEGVETPEGFLELDVLELPAARRGDAALYNRVPVSLPAPSVLEELRRRTSASFRLATGRFITVSAGSGSEDRVRELESRWQPLLESMEGAAVALVCWERETPFHEIRGVSNRVGPRDRASWDVDTALRNAALTAMELLHAQWTGL